MPSRENRQSRRIDEVRRESRCDYFGAADLRGMPADPGPPNMMHQILGALQIRDGKERDTALATACRESADQGSAPAVLMGIPKIEDVTLRDQVAEECADTLEESGETQAAIGA